MHKVRVAVLAVLLVGAACAAQAGEKVLPDGIRAHISVAAPEKLVANVDGFAAAISQGTANQVPAGMLSMVALMNMPISRAVLPLDKEVHILFPGNGYNFPGFGLLLNVPSLDKLAGEMKKLGAETAKEGDGYIFRLPRIGPLLAIPLDGGRALLLNNPILKEGTLAALKAWTPVHAGKGDISGVLKLDENWLEEMPFAPELDKFLSELAGLDPEKGAQKAGEANINPETVRGIVRLAQKHVPTAIDELDMLRGVRLDIALDQNRANLAFALRFADGSILNDMAVAASTRGNQELSFMTSVGEDAYVAGQTAALERILPNGQKRIGEFFRDAAAEIFPSLKDRLFRLQDAALAVSAGESAIGHFFDDGQDYSVTWTKAKDAEKFIALQRDGFELFNAMVNETILEPKGAFGFAVSDGKAGDVSYLLIKPRWKDDATREKFGDFMTSTGDKSAAEMLAALDKMTIYVARRDDVVVVIGGDVGEDELLAALDAVGGVEDALVATPAAKQSLDDISYRQNAVMLFNADTFATVVIHKFMEQMDQRAPGAAKSDGFKEFADMLRTDMVKSESVAAIGLGGADSWLFWELSVPNPVINAVWLNYEMISKYFQVGSVTVRELPNGDDEDEDFVDDEEDAEEPEAEAAPQAGGR